MAHNMKDGIMSRALDATTGKMSELQDEIDKAKQPIVDMISPDLYFEYYLFRLQLDGYYILWVDISKEKKEIYIRAYHHDSRKRLYVAIAMDGHLIPVEEIEKMAADTDIMRCPIYWEHACKSYVAFAGLRERLQSTKARIRKDT